LLKLEKRSGGVPDETPQEPAKQSGNGSGRKPVIVYIMILFIVAFVLMAVSFVMHQRSNTEVIGKLQNSVNALQEVQEAQDKNLQLQQELEDAQAENQQLQKQLDEANTSADSAGGRADALLALYTLQQQYSGQNYDACKATISGMEADGLDKLLPAEAPDGVTTPAQRYLQLKEAVESK